MMDNKSSLPTGAEQEFDDRPRVPQRHVNKQMPLALPGPWVFDGLENAVLRLGLRTLHKCLDLPLLETDHMDHDALRDLWDAEWAANGTEYDRCTELLRNENKEFLQQSRLKWAVRTVNEHITDRLGPLYLEYVVSRVQERPAILDSKSLIISGGVGTGKTMALAWRCQTLALEKAIEHDYDRIEDLLVIWPSGELFNNLHKGLNVCENAAIFGIDDYGAEYVEPFALSQFELLIEHRCARKLTTIITTNIPKVMFKTRHGFERIESRLLKRCTWVDFTGQDRRKALKGPESI